MPEELDISVEEIIAVAQAALRGDSLRTHAANIRQHIDEALVAFHTLDEALKVANQSHDDSDVSVTPEDRKVVDAAQAYVKAENRMLHVLLRFAEDGGAHSGGFNLPGSGG